MPSPDHYIPGVCNIGAEEIKMRRRMGWGGLITSIILGALLIYFQAPAAWRLLIFFPATSAASGFFQSTLHFCLGFGFKAVFNFGNVGTTDSVAEAEFRRLDRRKAQAILVYALLSGAAVAVLFYCL